MSLHEQQFTIGEVAKATGLKVRTLQHYDNIGLLPVSGRTEGGRRYYTQNNILRLEQIVFINLSVSDLLKSKKSYPKRPRPKHLKKS